MRYSSKLPFRLFLRHSKPQLPKRRQGVAGRFFAYLQAGMVTLCNLLAISMLPLCHFDLLTATNSRCCRIFGGSGIFGFSVKEYLKRETSLMYFWRREHNVWKLCKTNLSCLRPPLAGAIKNAGGDPVRWLPSPRQLA
jgi:hypothetical protein